MTPAVPLPWVSTPAAPPTVLPNRTEAEFYVASVCFKHGPPRLLGAVPQYLVPASSQQPLPYGSTVTVEPGGQLEISSPPCASLTELIATVEGDTAALTDLLDPAGLVLTGSGSDPHRPLSPADRHPPLRRDGSRPPGLNGGPPL